MTASSNKTSNSTSTAKKPAEMKKPELTFEIEECQRNGYALERKFLGKGNYASVWLAQPTPEMVENNYKLRLLLKPGQTIPKVAIKIVNADTVSRNYICKFLPREISTMSINYEHPNVIKLLDFFATEKRIYVVMEYADGGDLLRHVNSFYSRRPVGSDGKRVRAPGLTEKQARDIFRDVIRAIRHVHSNDVAHRDLKFENILLTEGGTVAKVSDFGFAVKRGECEPLHNTHCGSYAYAAPEVLRRLQYDGKQADVWSLGVILFGLIQGFLPFKATTAKGVLEATRKTLYLRPKVSEEYKELIRGLLNKVPEERLTADEIIKADWFREESEDEIIPDPSGKTDLAARQRRKQERLVRPHKPNKLDDPAYISSQIKHIRFDLDKRIVKPRHLRVAVIPNPTAASAAAAIASKPPPAPYGTPIASPKNSYTGGPKVLPSLKEHERKVAEIEYRLSRDRPHEKGDDVIMKRALPNKSQLRVLEPIHQPHAGEKPVKAPTNPKPARTQPTRTQPTRTKPTRTKPVRTEPAKTELVSKDGNEASRDWKKIGKDKTTVGKDEAHRQGQTSKENKSWRDRYGAARSGPTLPNKFHIRSWQFKPKPRTLKQTAPPDAPSSDATSPSASRQSSREHVVRYFSRGGASRTVVIDGTAPSANRVPPTDANEAQTKPMSAAVTRKFLRSPSPPVEPQVVPVDDTALELGDTCSDAAASEGVRNPKSFSVSRGAAEPHRLKPVPPPSSSSPREGATGRRMPRASLRRDAAARPVASEEKVTGTALNHAPAEKEADLAMKSTRKAVSAPYLPNNCAKTSRVTFAHDTKKEGCSPTRPNTAPGEGRTTSPVGRKRNTKPLAILPSRTATVQRELKMPVPPSAPKKSSSPPRRTPKPPAKTPQTVKRSKTPPRSLNMGDAKALTSDAKTKRPKSPLRSCKTSGGQKSTKKSGTTKKPAKSLDATAARKVPARKFNSGSRISSMYNSLG